MDYPEFVPDLPVGHPPENEAQISAMMQRNDQFIQAAIIAGLVRNVYLVFPSWTSNTSVVYNASIGQTTLSCGKRQFCMCFASAGGEDCQTTNSGDALNELQIPSANCTERTPYRHIELTSENAAGYIKHSKYVALPMEDTANPLILDIDEDFFGVQLVGNSYVNAEGDMNMAFSMNELVQGLFCIQRGTTKSEVEADSWFRGLIGEVKENCLPQGMCLHAHDNQSLLGNCLAGIHRSKIALQPHHVCDNYEGVDFYVARLAILLSYHTVQQLNVLSDIGVCFDNAWKTHAYEARVGLCLGHNLPTESIVMEHIPSTREFIELGKNFTRLLRALAPRTPDVITIARSSRDGYTPRGSQQFVETVIVKVLKRVFNLSDENINFSDYLAGGTGGWLKR